MGDDLIQGPGLMMLLASQPCAPLVYHMLMAVPEHSEHRSSESEGQARHHHVTDVGRFDLSAGRQADVDRFVG